MSREQSIAFLRSLKGQERGATIYQQVIDDVLGEIDSLRSDLARLTRERDEWEANEQEVSRRLAAAMRVVDAARELAAKYVGNMMDGRTHRTWRPLEAALLAFDAASPAKDGGGT